MIGGALIVGVCLLILGWTEEIIGLFVTEPELVSAEKYRLLDKVQRLTRATETIMYHYLGCSQHLCGGFCDQCGYLSSSVPVWRPLILVQFSRHVEV